MTKLRPHGEVDAFTEIAWRPPSARAANDERWFAPAVDIFEDDDAVLVKVELPGVRPEDVVVDASDGVLSVRGERHLENADRRDAYRRLERSYGPFARTFALPAGVDGASAVAVMADGVLTIRLPKSEAAPGDRGRLRRAS